MTLFLAKSLVGILFLASALAAALSMLFLTGRVAPGNPSGRPRTLHKLAGRAFILLTLINSAAGFLYFLKAGDQLPLRGVLHIVLALALNAVLALKLGVVKPYRQYLRMAPALGLTLLVLAFVIFMITAGFHLFRPAPAAAPDPAEAKSAQTALGDPALGSRLFGRMCASCHYPDREETKDGPGLKGLFALTALPASGRPVTEENIALQLRRPLRTMPEFSRLAGRDLADLLAYLRTL
jgi:mono/diheme cytochrome c family protein